MRYGILCKFWLELRMHALSTGKLLSFRRKRCLQLLHRMRIKLLLSSRHRYFVNLPISVNVSFLVRLHRLHNVQRWVVLFWTWWILRRLSCWLYLPFEKHCNCCSRNQLWRLVWQLLLSSQRERLVHLSRRICLFN